MWDFLHCFTGRPALAQTKYKKLVRSEKKKKKEQQQLVRTIFFSFWSGVPGVRNPNGSCVFVYQTRRLLKSCHQNIAPSVSVCGFMQGQRDMTRVVYSTGYVTVFIPA